MKIQNTLPKNYARWYLIFIKRLDERYVLYHEAQRAAWDIFDDGLGIFLEAY